MRTTFDRAADVIARSCDLSREMIRPESHILDDLGVDSLDFFDTVFALDKEFEVKIPFAKFGDDELMEVGKLCATIDQLLAAKAAGAEAPTA